MIYNLEEMEFLKFRRHAIKIKRIYNNLTTLPKGFVEKFSIGFEACRIFSYFLCSKGGLNVHTLANFSHFRMYGMWRNVIHACTLGVQ